MNKNDVAGLLAEKLLKRIYDIYESVVVESTPFFNHFSKTSVTTGGDGIEHKIEVGLPSKGHASFSDAVGSQIASASEIGTYTTITDKLSRLADLPVIDLEGDLTTKEAQYAWIKSREDTVMSSLASYRNIIDNAIFSEYGECGHIASLPSGATADQRDLVLSDVSDVYRIRKGALIGFASVAINPLAGHADYGKPLIIHRLNKAMYKVIKRDAYNKKITVKRINSSDPALTTTGNTGLTVNDKIFFTNTADWADKIKGLFAWIPTDSVKRPAPIDTYRRDYDPANLSGRHVVKTDSVLFGSIKTAFYDMLESFALQDGAVVPDTVVISPAIEKAWSLAHKPEDRIQKQIQDKHTKLIYPMIEINGRQLKVICTPKCPSTKAYFFHSTKNFRVQHLNDRLLFFSPDSKTKKFLRSSRTVDGLYFKADAVFSFVLLNPQGMGVLEFKQS